MEKGVEDTRAGRMRQSGGFSAQCSVFTKPVRLLLLGTDHCVLRPLGTPLKGRACRAGPGASTMRAHMIAVEGLSKLYGDVAAVNGLGFEVRAGEVLGLVGPNGAGKTTALRCLAGIIPATEGRVSIGGCDIREDPLGAKRQLAFFPDEPRLFEYLTVRQHLEFTARLYQVRDAAERGRGLLETLELADKADALPSELSRGMKQKVALACGFIHQPGAMFFDEPLTGLDPLAIRRTKDLIVRKAREGAAVIISSHLLHLLEEVCSHVLILRRGTKIAHGTLDEIRSQHREGDKDSTLEEIFIRLVGEDAGK